MRTDYDVLIIGGGPVGLTMAIDLKQRGVHVAIVEQRREREPPSPKCNHVSSSSMEQFRRLGFAEAVRNAGLPADYPNDIAFRTTMCGTELSRITIPARARRFTDVDGPDGWWPTPEPPHRINQIYLEPILVDQAIAHAIPLMNRTQFLSMNQESEGVAATVEDMVSGERRTLTARYLVGCDGGRSQVRREIGATFHGTPVIQRVQSTFIRAPSLLGRMAQPAWYNYSMNPRRSGAVLAVDGVETWIVHNHLNPGEDDFEAIDRDWAVRAILGVDQDFEYEILAKEDWIGRRLVSDKLREGRVFLAGDAAHLWVPYAGFGMNAGIADAADLAWLLAARVQGWGGDAILDAYEAERLPITDQVSRYAMEHAQAVMRARAAIPENIEAPDAAGENARARIGAEAYALNVAQFCCAGLNFGYFYEGSPIILGDGEPAPHYSMGDFTPSTVPGCRTPHFWLDDGRSLYDALGTGYTLLRTNGDADVLPLVEAAEDLGMPLAVLDVSRCDLPSAYRHALLLVRPDKHVAWRGDALPRDVSSLLATLCGMTNANADHADNRFPTCQPAS
jgi:2-polyprenyl-6-methoxyphenol hydroxylase-like FAD-dependent oxidoreductase